jgi:hypothetical protein
MCGGPRKKENGLRHFVERARPARVFGASVALKILQNAWRAAHERQLRLLRRSKCLDGIFNSCAVADRLKLAGWLQQYLSQCFAGVGR